MLGEYLKYCGNETWAAICIVMQRMWVKARNGESGSEAKAWPETWRMGLMCFFMEKKGGPQEQEHMERRSSVKRWVKVASRRGSSEVTEMDE